MQFKTPILLIVFNRKESALKVIDEIRKQAPLYLYVAADGPRFDRPEDIVKCMATREAVLKAIDWPCTIKTFFREENRGCGYGPSEAITWFFNEVEQGIILEDDILPAFSFFQFCEELLEKYKDNSKIVSISGTNLISQSFTNPNPSESYYFSNYSGIWGWASWRRAWHGYDYSISTWNPKMFREKFKGTFNEAQFLFFDEIFARVYKKNIAVTWDYQWWYHKLNSGGIGIIPAKNLTINIGFTSDATHDFDAPTEIRNAQLQDIKFPLVHPQKTVLNRKFDTAIAGKYYEKRLYKSPSIFKRALNKVFK